MLRRRPGLQFHHLRIRTLQCIWSATAGCSVETSQNCPFDPSMCISDNETSVRFDSGLINSLSDLGIHSRPGDSVSFRKVVECAPIATEGYSPTYTAQNLTDDAASLLVSIDQTIHDQFTAYFYGANTAWGTNATFVFVNDSFDTSAASTLTPYRIHADWSWPNTSTDAFSTFEPIPELQKTDAKVFLMFLSSVALYPAPVLDPWFDAQVPVVKPVKVGPYTQYAAKNAANVLGCTDKTEICNPALGLHEDNCTVMTGGDVVDMLDPVRTQLHLNDRQAKVVSRIYNHFTASVDIMAQIRQDGELLATSSTDYWASAQLPSTQWILELDHWFAMLMAYVQLLTVEYVTGPDNPAYRHWIASPEPEDEWMCNNQIVQREDHASFSVLGLALILSIGGAFILINLTLSSLWPRLRRDTISQYRDERWNDTELLELQRLVSKGAVGGSMLEKSKAKLGRSQSGISDASQASTKVPGHQVSSVVSSMLTPDERCSSLDPLSATTTIDMQLQQDDFPPEDLRLLLSKRAPTS